MSSKNQVIAPPKDWQSFERLCADLFREIWSYPQTQCNGRLGQPQAGVDVYGRNSTGWVGVQCKGRTGDYLKRTPISVAFLEAAVEEAKAFEPALSEFVLATTAPNSQDIQKAARELTEQHEADGLFSVSVLGWEELERRLCDHEEVPRSHGLLPRPERLQPSIFPTGESFQYRPEEAEEALAHYTRILLATNDIVDLGELSALDAELASSTPQLRHLYIPLRGPVAARGANALAVTKSFTRRRRRTARGFADLESGAEGDSESNAANQLSGKMSESRPLATQLEQAFRMVLLADPGAGKTTFVRWLVTGLLLRGVATINTTVEIPGAETLPKWGGVPVVVLCRNLDTDRDVASVQNSIFRSLQALEISPDLLGATYCALWAAVCSGDVILVVDGLDEISDVRRREQFRAQIQNFSRVFRNVPILITSRIYGYAELGRSIASDFAHATIDPLDDGQKALFARQWAAVAELPDRASRAASELIEACSSSVDVRDMTGNPLMLTTLALVLRTHGAVPERRCKLYSEAIALLFRWRSRTDERLDPRAAERRLAYVAFAMTDLGRQRLREDELIELWEEMSDELPRFRRLLEARTPRDFLDALERRSSILVNVGREYFEGEHLSVYEFRHLSFQDFLAGRAISLSCYREGARTSVEQKLSEIAGRAARRGFRALSSRWYEPLQLCVGDLDELGANTEVHLEAVLSADDDVSEEGFFRAAHCMDMLCDDLQVSYDFVRRLCDRFADTYAACPYRPSFLMTTFADGGDWAALAPRSVRRVGSSSWGKFVEAELGSRLAGKLAVPAISHLDSLEILWWSGVDDAEIEARSAEVCSGRRFGENLLRASTLLRFLNSAGLDAPAELVAFVSGALYDSEEGAVCAAYSLLSHIRTTPLDLDVGALLGMCSASSVQEVLVMLMNAGVDTVVRTVRFVESQSDDVLKYLAAALAAVLAPGGTFASRYRSWVYASSKFTQGWDEKTFSAESFASLCTSTGLFDGTEEGSLRAIATIENAYGWVL